MTLKQKILKQIDVPLWRRVIHQFPLEPDSDHGFLHWLTVHQNGMHLSRFHAADVGVVSLFALFHDSCCEHEYWDKGHSHRGAELAIHYRRMGYFRLDDVRMDLLVTACRIHHGGDPQSDPTLGVCMDADRLDLRRVGICPSLSRLSTETAKSIVRRHAWAELREFRDNISLL